MFLLAEARNNILPPFYYMVGVMIKNDLQQVSLDRWFLLAYMIRENSLLD